LFRERQENARQAFLEEIEAIPIDLDESGIDESLQRELGWSLRGERLYGETSGKSRKRFSFIAALNVAAMMAPIYFEGYTDTRVFNTWVEHCLVPELTPGQTVILDNASFHKSVRTQELIEAAGCHLKYLPTYSPDFNPIENQWAILKARIRKHRQPSSSIERTLHDVFQMYY